MTPIGGPTHFLASAVSSDGSVVVLEDDYGLFRWEEGAVLELFKGSFYSFATAGDVSADGSIVVGTNQTFFPNPPEPPDYASVAVWGPPNDQGEYPVRFLSGLNVRHPRDYAFAVSPDGSVLVGWSENTSRNRRAVRWEGRDILVLGGLGGEESGAYGVSADGSVVVGWAEHADGLQDAFRWENDTMVGLGMLPGDWEEGLARAVSGDGSVVVGYVSNESDDEPFIWDEDHGIRSLTELLTQHGIDLSDWDLDTAVDISADGRVIVGNGYHISAARSEGWIATIPEPSTLTTLATLAAALFLARLCRKRKR
jgi:probable HAF family extracellular repeat protein